jgi:hypothetical protein
MEDIMPSGHPKLPATKANCERDHRNKLKLNEEFTQFKKLLKTTARSSPDVKKLVIPLNKLERAIIIGAHGIHLEPVEKRNRS